MSAERMHTGDSGAESAPERVLHAAAHELRQPLEVLSAVQLAGDASSRQYVRVTHPGGSLVGVRYPKPFSLGDASMARFERWCDENPDDGALTFANDPVCHIEMTALLSRAGVPVPEILAVDDRDGIILLEDAGDDIVQSWMAGAPEGEIIAVYERAVDLIAGVRSATDAAREAGSTGAHLAFDSAKLLWELEFFRMNTFDSALGAPLSESELAGFRRETEMLAGALASRPRFLCHRDYHSRNLMVRPGSKPADGLVVIDFQDARMGPITYDLVSLLEDPYAQLQNWLRQKLVSRFRELAYADGTWPGDADFGEAYDLMTVQRMLKAVGTFTNQAVSRGRRDYLPYVTPAVDSARAALERLSVFPTLGTLAGRIDVAAMDPR